VAVEPGEDREVVVGDRPDGPEALAVDLVEAERAAQQFAGPVELLLLVLAALDRREGPLLLDDALDVLGRGGDADCSSAVNGRSPVRSAQTMPSSSPRRSSGTAQRSVTAGPRGPRRNRAAGAGPTCS
jgi:hypothetical protein